MIVDSDSYIGGINGDVSSHQSDKIIFLDVFEGVNKKGHVYGLGSKHWKYKSSRSSTSNVISQSKYEQMSVENASLK